MSDNPTNGASTGGGEPAASGLRADDISIEVETDSEDPASAGDPATVGAVAGEEIAVEVDSRDSDTAERIAQLEADKVQLEKEKQDNWDRLLRATADLENYRKRARRDIEEARIDARSKVLRAMLDVIDSLERAVDHAEGADDPEKVHQAMLEGVKLVLRQFAQALERFEVKPVNALGEPFDPNLHEAIQQFESAEHPPGSVVNVPQKGYTIGDRLLRPSLVVVAKAPAEPAPAAAEQPESGAPAEPGGAPAEPGGAPAEPGGTPAGVDEAGNPDSAGSGEGSLSDSGAGPEAGEGREA